MGCVPLAMPAPMLWLLPVTMPAPILDLGIRSHACTNIRGKWTRVLQFASLYKVQFCAAFLSHPVGHLIQYGGNCGYFEGLGQRHWGLPLLLVRLLWSVSVRVCCFSGPLPHRIWVIWGVIGFCCAAFLPHLKHMEQLFFLPFLCNSLRA